MAKFEKFQELLDLQPRTAARICEAIAQIFEVRPTEVGLLVVEGDFLTFLSPVELQAAGVIPLSSSAVAARTAANRQGMVFNRFPQVPHHTVFEQIKLNNEKPLSELPDPIQKLMSAPIIAEDGFLFGVVQVSRKGMTPGIAGADFSDEDLHLLERVARQVAVLLTDLKARREPEPGETLRFRNSNKRASA